jgi:hypothetical protein
MFSDNTTPFTMPVMPANNFSGNGMNGFGGDGWWIILLFIFIAAFGGLGNNGANGNDTGYLSANYALVSDNATIERKIDSVYSGICDSTFALNNTITNGFASAQNTMTQGFAGLNSALIQQGYEGRIATQNVGNAVSNCCCDLKQQIGDVKYTIGSTGAELNYNLATQANMLDRTVSDKFCQTNFNAATNTRDIIDNQRADTQAILAKLDAMENARKDEQIAALQAKNFDLRLAASQAAQNNYLVSELRPSPIPAYQVANPYCCNTNGCLGCQG